MVDCTANRFLNNTKFINEVQLGKFLCTNDSAKIELKGRRAAE
jgi:hypothetical protein